MRPDQADALANPLNDTHDFAAVAARRRMKFLPDKTLLCVILAVDR